MKRIKLIVMGIMIFGPMAALADPIVTLDGEDYAISITTHGRIYLTSYLESTPWFGDQAAAMSAAQQIGDYFGQDVPYFLYDIQFQSHAAYFDNGVHIATDVPKYNYSTFAVLKVSEPGTLALFGLGLAALGFSRRQRKTAEV